MTAPSLPDPSANGDSRLDAALAAAFGPSDAPGDGAGVLPPRTSPVAGTGAGDAGPPERYVPLGEIGRGGMGVVYRVRDTALGREVALKVLQEEFAGDADRVQRFLDEACICGQLQHPGVPPVYDPGRWPDGRPYFAMKLVQGQTLAALLGARREPAEDRVRFLTIFQQVCQTLAYAHARGVVHRDLKPANVMVGAFGEVQVMDWGLAKVLPGGGAAGPGSPAPAAPEDGAAPPPRVEAAGGRSLPGQVMGTPPYMPPEQARGEVGLLDQRCDVFALGALLCEILTGAPPYAGAAAHHQARTADLAGALDRLRACGADPDLLRLAERCLAADPGGRPADAGAVAPDVTAYLASVEQRLRAAELAAVEARVRAAQERKARWLTATLAASVLGTVLVAAGGGWWLAHEREVRRATTAAAVNEALAQARELRRQGQAAMALALAKRAEGLLAAGEADDGLRRQVRDLVAGLEAEEEDRGMVARLEHASLREIAMKAGGFDSTQAESAYAQAFSGYLGVDVNAVPFDEAVSRMRGRAIRVELAAALFRWAGVRAGAADRERLIEMARAVEPDPRRQELFAALAKPDSQPAVRQLVADADVDSLPAPTLSVLGDALWDEGAFAEAVLLLRKAQRRFPGDFWINYRLGCSLLDSKPSQQAEAIRFLTTAVALNPHSAVAYHCLGQALGHPRLDEAIAAFEEAARLEPDWPEVCLELARYRRDRGDYGAAAAAYKEALRRQPDSDEAWAGLAHALQRTGQFAEALEAVREADRRVARTRLLVQLQARLLAPNSAAPVFPQTVVGLEVADAYLSDRRLRLQRSVRTCERLLALEPRLPAILAGEDGPANRVEQVDLAQLCLDRRLYATAARTYQEVLDAAPDLTADRNLDPRYNAACAAARAGCDQGEDTARLDAAERARWRKQALDWLEALRKSRARQLNGGSSQVGRDVRQELVHWQYDADLAGLRDRAKLDKLPKEEQDACRAFWGEVSRLLTQLRQ
jgi:serine/threonine-protein kinase